jgi:hypothetical protein
MSTNANSESNKSGASSSLITDNKCISLNLQRVFLLMLFKPLIELTTGNLQLIFATMLLKTYRAPE